MPCFPYPHVQSFNFDRSIGQVTPKIHFFSLPKKILPGSKCPQNNLFDYENRSTAHGASATLHWQELYHPTLLFSGFFWLGAHGTKLERVTHVTVGDQYYLFFNSETLFTNRRAAYQASTSLDFRNRHHRRQVGIPHSDLVFKFQQTSIFRIL